MATISKINGYNLKDKISGYITGITSNDVTTALGYTPVNKAGDTMANDLNFTANKGINFITSGRLYWKENNYGDQFAIVPAFSGADDANLLKIQSAVGAQGTTPDMTDKITIAGKTGNVNLLTGDLTLTAGSINTTTGAINTVGDLNLKTSGSSSDDSADIVWWYGNGNEKMRIWSPNTPTAKVGPSFRIFNSSGTSLYSGTLPLADGTGASGTWDISISGNAATATNAVNADNIKTVAEAEPTGTTTVVRYPVLADSNNSSAAYEALKTNMYFNFSQQPDWSVISIGRANDSKGYIRLYDIDSAYYGQIRPTTLTGNRTCTLPNTSGTILVNDSSNYVQLYSGTLSSGSTTFTGANYSAYLIVGAEGRGYRSSIVVPRSLITTTEEQWMVTFYGASSIENVRFGLKASAATGGTITITWKSGKTITQIYGIR